MDSVGSVGVYEIVPDGKGSAGGIDAVYQVFACFRVYAVAGDDISVDEHAIAVSQQSLIPVLMDVAVADDDVVGVVELDAIPAVADFKSFHSNPADGILIALLCLKQDTMPGRGLSRIAGLNDRVLARIVFQHAA